MSVPPLATVTPLTLKPPASKPRRSTRRHRHWRRRAEDGPVNDQLAAAVDRGIAGDTADETTSAPVLVTTRSSGLTR